jgi:outer membrane protein assembly factor BamB
VLLQKSAIFNRNQFIPGKTSKTFSMKSFKIISISVLVLTLVSGIQPVKSQQFNWTHFRGSNLNGISDDQNTPVTWNDSTNIIWKTDIQGKGWSSPVVYGDQVWVTSAGEDGKQMAGICLDFITGKIIYSINLFQPDTTFPKHTINTYATPTPCIEEGFVYLNFGTYGTACVDTRNAKVIWKRTDLHCDHVQGPGSSPILYKNLIILHVEGIDVQYLIALDKRTGETVWKTDRPVELYEPLAPIGKKAYITPIIMKVNGEDLLISNGSAVCIAYNPLTGKEVWRIVQGVDSTIAMPVSENGIVYFFPSFVSGPNGENYTELLAVNPEGSGDITKTNVLWRFKSPVLQLLTPLIKDGLIYTVDTQNMLYCLDAKTGKEVYSKKLKQKYNSSPVFAGGNIYFTSVKGATMVIKAGNQLQIIAENKLPGEVYATPAFVRNSILLRTDSQLYRIGMK